MASGLSLCSWAFRTPPRNTGLGIGIILNKKLPFHPKQIASYGWPNATASFTGSYSVVLTSLWLLNCCCWYCQTPAQDPASPTDLQKKTKPKLHSKQTWDQKMMNRQFQHRRGQLFPSPCQTGLTENHTRKRQEAMASDKNGRKTQAASCYLFYLPSWIFLLAVATSECLVLSEKSWQHHKKPTGRCPLPSSQFGASLWFTPHMSQSTYG